MNRAPPACLVSATADGRPAAQLWVLLAAAGDRIDALRAGCTPVPDGVDCLYVESALDGLGDGSLPAALYEHWLQPLRARYRRIVLGDLSIGGLLALALTDTWPDLADAHVLIAPYPGNRGLIADLAATGGAGAWLHRPAPETLERRGWRGLQTLAASGRPPWLGYGAADRFADGLQQMACLLPPACVEVIDGGHDWPTWQRLWAHWLAIAAAPA